MSRFSARRSPVPGPILAGLLALGFLLPAADSRAQQGAPPASSLAVPQTAVPPPADIMVGNRKVATLRGVFFQNPPRDRARVANERIEAAIEAGGPLQVTVRSEAGGRLFAVGGRGVFGLTPGDLDEAAGETLDQAAAATAARLEQAVREAREQRSLPDLLKALALNGIPSSRYGAWCKWSAKYDWVKRCGTSCSAACSSNCSRPAPMRSGLPGAAAPMGSAGVAGSGFWFLR